MTPSQLSAAILRKRSFLCVGLDTELPKIPAHLREYGDPIYEFNRRIIEATRDYAVAYKPNIAFFEALGSAGWDSLQRTLDAIPDDCLAIADAKRGDIGNTARLYATTFFETYPFDACTVAPYMGHDSVGPFLDWEHKWTFLLALTSNPGAADFQYIENSAGQALFEQVVATAERWAEGKKGHLGYVVGATRADHIARVRALAPDAFLLVPGVGAQGGDLEAVCRNGRNDHGGLLINASRSIIYADNGPHFDDAAAAAARAMQRDMAEWL